MAPTSGGSGDGDEIGAVLCLGGRERPRLYSGTCFNSINLWLSVVNDEGKSLFYEAEICDIQSIKIS
jgi:hypothetical protein